MKKIQVLMINEKAELNNLYRSFLLDLLKKEFIKLASIDIYFFKST